MSKQPKRLSKRKTVKQTSAKPRKGAVSQLYTLDVFILQGMLTEAFAKKNPEISRTIQIRGDQTLAELHDVIFDAFDREDEHLYEVQFGKGPRDFDGPRYRRKMPGIMFDVEADQTGVAEETTIGSLGLEAGRAFAYWFDFGDDWWHQINVVTVDDVIPKGKFPKVTNRVGASPPQYPDMDDELD